MALESAVELTVINPEDDGNNRIRYRRLDTGKIVPPQSIEFLQAAAILLSHDGKSKEKIIIYTRDSYILEHANAVVLGEKFVGHGICAASYCKARL
jgi:hypothetical protein